MTEKEFRKLSRAQYLEMMVEQGREIKRLKEELELARKEIEEKEIKIQEAGSIADAALALNDVFGSAQKAADQYVESIRIQKEKYEEKLCNAEKVIIENVQLAQRYLDEAKAKCGKTQADTRENRIQSEEKADKEIPSDPQEEPTKLEAEQLPSEEQPVDKEMI